MIELALPAGNLESALCAFRSGADAVYFGMKEFSARKGAVNFDEEDLSKISRYAKDNGRRIYVTVNTLVDDGEIEKANSLLSMLDFYEPDGVIVQDLGLVEIMRRHYPALPLHGSTQLAVHTVEGVRQMQDLGFSRVVLSRELTLDEIAAIRQACPDVELKVFIHGALCYGFSGLCMASANVCGRSANRGECAQICRTWFTEEESGRNGWFFSMEDLAAGRTLKTLDEMGIDSAKIEGRLKGDAYVAALTRYYRAVLEGRDTGELEDEIRTTFSRRSGQGYLDYRKGRPSLLSGYPSHLGLECGRIIDQGRETITVALTKSLANRDGVQYFTKNRHGLDEAVKFPCRIVSRGGDKAMLRWHSDEDLVGRTLYKISSSTQNERRQNTNLPLFSKPVPIKVTIGPDRIEAEALGVSVRIPVSISPAKTTADITGQITEIFSQSDTSRYTLGTLEVENMSGTDNPFLPLSFLKRLRRDLYQKLDAIHTRPVVPDDDLSCVRHFILPRRELLEGDLPWSLDVKEVDGEKYITLPPVTFDEAGLFAEVERLLAEHDGLIVGINNIGQIRLAKRHPGHRWFADVYMYQANAWADRLLRDEIGDSFIGGYLWLERDAWKAPWPCEPTVTRWQAPSFISRTCFRHDDMGEPCSTCNGRYDYEISQNGVEYVVKVRSCLSVVEMKGRCR